MILKGLTIVKPVIYGNISRYFGKKRDEDGHTHQWTVYVKPYKNEVLLSHIWHLDTSFIKTTVLNSVLLILFQKFVYFISIIKKILTTLLMLKRMLKVTFMFQNYDIINIFE